MLFFMNLMNVCSNSTWHISPARMPGPVATTNAIREINVENKFENV